MIGFKLNTEEFIQRSILIHGSRYDYSSVVYKNYDSKVKIICYLHGEFEQRPNDHLSGNGCAKCNGNAKLTTKEFIIKASKIHNNKYDYSLVNYINGSTHIKINCYKHGIFESRANSHLQGAGCRKCSNENQSLTNINFVLKAIGCHGNKYDYSSVIYTNNSTKVKISCPLHGEFEQRPADHLKLIGCPKCKSSKGEIKIRKTLEEYEFNFIEQKTFDDCKNKNVLSFDFYLPDYNICIEFDGKQHFEVINRSKDHNKNLQNFIDISLNDMIKNTYCLTNNIKLIRIPYWKYSEIEQILNYI